MATLPKLAIDKELGKEPEELANYHSSRKRLGFKHFMPKNEKEMDMILAYQNDTKFLSKFWGDLEFDIKGEIRTRLTDCEEKFVQKYADHMCNFIALTDMPKYRAITECLFHNPINPYSDFEFILNDIFHTIYLMHVQTEKQKILHKYIVERVHEAFVKHHCYERSHGPNTSYLTFIDFYNSYANNEKTEEHQQIAEEVTKTIIEAFTDGSFKISVKDDNDDN